MIITVCCAAAVRASWLLPPFFSDRAMADGGEDLKRGVREEEPDAPSASGGACEGEALAPPAKRRRQDVNDGFVRGTCAYAYQTYEISG